MFVSVAKLAAAGLGPGRVPGLGDLAIAPQGRTADLVPGQLLDSFQNMGRFTGVEAGANLIGHPVGQAEPGSGQ